MIEEWHPPVGQSDSMPLRLKEVIIVEKKGAQWMKGRIKHPEPFPSYNTSGYFPSRCVEEVKSFHHISRRVKNLHARNTPNRKSSVP